MTSRYTFPLLLTLLACSDVQPVPVDEQPVLACGYTDIRAESGYVLWAVGFNPQDWWLDVAETVANGECVETRDYYHNDSVFVFIAAADSGVVFGRAYLVRHYTGKAFERVSCETQTVEAR